MKRALIEHSVKKIRDQTSGKTHHSVRTLKAFICHRLKKLRPKLWRVVKWRGNYN